MVEAWDICGVGGGIGVGCVGGSPLSLRKVPLRAD